MQEMGKKVNSSEGEENYDKEMQELLENGCIQYFQPGFSNVKILKYQTITDPEVADIKGVAVGEKAFLTDEPNHNLSLFQKLWLNIKALFSDEAKRELASYNFFIDNPVKDTNLQQEQKELDKKRYDETKIEIERAKNAQKIASANKDVVEKNQKNIIENISPEVKVKDLNHTDKLQDRLTKPQQVEKRIISIFKENPTNDYFKKDVIDASSLPTMELDKKNFKIDEKGAAYLALCLGISSNDFNTDSVYDLKEGVFNQILLGNSNKEINKDFNEVVKKGRANFNSFKDGAQPAELNILGFNVRNGIVKLNQILNTSHPAELMDPNSNCFLAAKIISETMAVLDNNPKLKAVVTLNAQSEELARGACAVDKIVSESLDAQKKLLSGNFDDIEYCADRIATEAKLRSAMAVNEFASYGVEKLTKLKETDFNLNRREKIDLYQEIYPGKVANAVILKLGANENYFSNEAGDTVLEKMIKSASKNDIKDIIKNGMQEEAHRQSSKIIKDMKLMPQATKADKNLAKANDKQVNLEK